ncbi:hypothetical protein F4802DRAFT_187349 [Xylaria palmicola]|nr:hypothetical protein F4802DRAFT_187349 [Xylaria palmicola]
MASALPVPSTRNTGNKSRGRRIGALLDLSRGEPPLTTMRRNPQKEPQRSMAPAPVSSQPRSQTSRIPSTLRMPMPADNRALAHPSLANETQTSATNSRSAGDLAKPVTPANGDIEPPKQLKNVLRRKPSTFLRQPSNFHARGQSISDSKKASSLVNPQPPLNSAGSLSEHGAIQSQEEVRVKLSNGFHRPTAHPVQIYPELDRYRNIPEPPSRDSLGRDALYRLATEDLPPPTPQFSGASSSQLSNFSVSPSTRFSGSPGPGPYSRDTTPTSVCSQSPCLVAPMRPSIARVRQASPAETRPPVTRRRTGSVSDERGSFSTDPQGLAAVREALTSSSSNSTVRAEEKKNSQQTRRQELTPPNPPPRKSSQKFTKVRSADEVKPSSKSPQLSSPAMRSPSPAKPRKSAHNRVPSTGLSPQRRPTPPSRPSRDGTPDLYSQFGGPVPVIHSNLSSTSLTERRQSGILHTGSLPKTTTQRSSQDQAGSRRPSFSREATPAPPSGLQTSKNDTKKMGRPPSPNTSTFRSKFPLFGRRTKVGPEGTQTERKKERVPRRGPAAGTGHEGYGRVGAVRRRSSTASALQHGLPGLITSSESLPSTLSTDPFLLERMSPVIIAGGEVVENQNKSLDLTRTESNQSALRGRPGPGYRKLSVASSSTSEVNRLTLWPSPSLSEAVQVRRPSDNSELEESTMKFTSAHRKETPGFQQQDNKAINTRAPSAASTATTIYTDDSYPDVQAEQSRVLSRDNEPPKKLTKRSQSPRKWNFFGRAQAASSKKQKAESIPAMVQPSKPKPPAFYTMIDSPEPQEIDDGLDINTILHEAEVFRVEKAQPDYGHRPSTSSGTNQSTHMHPRNHNYSTSSKPGIIIPQIWQLDPRQEQSQVEKKTTEASRGRPSRLPQVGRIPKVVATRPEQMSPKSFSRPFNRISVQLLPAHTDQLDHESIAKGPSPPESVASTMPIKLPQETLIQASSPMIEHPGREFLAFEPRGNSGSMDSTESSCSGTAGYVNHIAQVPESLAPFGEDEVWDEYNDLLGDSPPSPTSSCGAPFQLETYHSSLAKKSPKTLEPLAVVTEPDEDVRISIATAKTATTSSHQSAEMTARINAGFRFDSDPPVTPFSVSEFVSSYDDNDGSKIESNQAPDVSARDRPASPGGEITKDGSNRSSQNSNRTSANSRLSEETPLSQVNLRVGSMTVSKWLTFGHVLFSPVREDLVNADSSLKRQSILVIDGLGNDDWSFYAAETYPAANFFNLSPRAPISREYRTTPSFPLSPPNHHQIQFTSHADKFPFGPDSFAALVFRFPSAGPEAHYRNIISEAERVLKPGGYIEFSILDLDLNNVGNRTRRAVRNLKEHASLTLRHVVWVCRSQAPLRTSRIEMERKTSAA